MMIGDAGNPTVFGIIDHGGTERMMIHSDSMDSVLWGTSDSRNYIIEQVSTHWEEIGESENIDNLL